MKWDDGNWGVACYLRMYNDGDCVDEIGFTKDDWNIPHVSDANNDRLSSYQINF
jgi:hypothetical protein